MKFNHKQITILLLFFSLGFKGYAQDSLEHIYIKHIKALGGFDNLQKIHSVKKISSTLVNNTKQTSVFYSFDTIYERIEIINESNKDITIVCGYKDSSLVWNKVLGEQAMSTYKATEKVTNHTPKSKKSLKNKHFYNSFIDYQKDNYKCFYLGKEIVNGKQCFKIKVIVENNVEDYYFIDCNNYLLVMEYTVLPYDTYQIKKYYDDYRIINGVAFAFKTSNSGIGYNAWIQYEKIETNIPVDPRLFDCVPLPETTENKKD